MPEHPTEGRRRPARRESLRLSALLLLLLLLLVLAATACDDDEDDSRPAARDATPPAARAGSAPSPAAAARTVVAPRRPLPEPDVRWTRGGSERDTLLAYPREAAADAHNVYLLDSGRDQIVALRASDGRVAWRHGGQNAGRAARIAPTALAILPGGGVAVADAARHAILLFDPAGRLVRAQPLPADVGAPRSLCALSSTHFIAADADSAGSVIELRHDLPARRLPLPWPDLGARPRLTTQAWLAGSAGTPRCAVALVLGRGFALFDGASYSTPYRYIEPFDLPTVTRTVRGDSARRTVEERLSTDRVAATDLALDGDHVAIAFAGASGLRSRLIDLYDARTGAYAGSATFSRRISALAAHGRNYYVLHQRDGRPAVTALTLSADSALTRR